MTTIFVAKRLQEFTTPGSLGVVRNTRFICCHWPRPEVPFSPFGPGSRGIEVLGSPTPRGIIFPEDTTFLQYAPDALDAARRAYEKRWPHSRFVGLNEEQTDLFLEAYDRAVAALPDHATWFETEVR